MPATKPHTKGTARASTKPTAKPSGKPSTKQTTKPSGTSSPKPPPRVKLSPAARAKRAAERNARRERAAAMAESIRRAAAAYHLFVALGILIFGSGLLVLGIWLRVSGSGGPSDLVYSGSDFFDVALVAAILCILVGIFFIAAAVASIFALVRRHWRSKRFRLMHIVLSLLVLASLIMIAVVSFLVLTNRSAQFVRDYLAEAWVRTIVERPFSICSIESNLRCRGFADATCASERCATCGTAVVAGARAVQPCYSAIKASLGRIYFPLGILATIAIIFVCIDILVTCLM